MQEIRNLIMGMKPPDAGEGILARPVALGAGAAKAAA
jgi:hypothetical protein